MLKSLKVAGFLIAMTTLGLGACSEPERLNPEVNVDCKANPIEVLADDQDPLRLSEVQKFILCVFRMVEDILYQSKKSYVQASAKKKLVPATGVFTDAGKEWLKNCDLDPELKAITLELPEEAKQEPTAEEQSSPVKAQEGSSVVIPVVEHQEGAAPAA